MSWTRKPVYLDVSPSEMLTLREQGLTNKQIAQQCGCHVNTVYRYIGKKSQAVANARAQNKPLPVPEAVATGYTGRPKTNEVIEEEKTMPEDRAQRDQMEIKPTQKLEPSTEYVCDMPVLKERRIMELQGEYCVFEVDTGDATVVMKNGEETAMVTGMLDAEGIHKFCRELMKVYGVINRSNAR